MGCRSRKDNFGLLYRCRLLLCSACRQKMSIPVLLAVSAVFICCFAESANAAIKCRGMFQVIKGHGLISTPYCQDKWLASYVRRYGVKVSFDSTRKSAMTIYIMPGFKSYQKLLNKLGKHRYSVSCLYINRLDQVDLKILGEIVRDSIARMKKIYPDWSA